MRPITAITRAGGAARRAQLFAMGVRPGALSAALRSGQVQRPHRGVYCLPEASADVIGARIWSGAATCVSACRLLGLPMPAGLDSRPHVSVGGHRGVAVGDLRPRDAVVLHVAGRPPNWRAATPIARALDDLGLCVGPEAHLVAVDAALRLGLLRAGQVASFRAAGAARRAFFVLNADARCDSPAETMARLALRRAGIAFEPHVAVVGTGVVDFVVDGRLGVEIDGRSYHSDAAQFVRDRARDRSALRAGLPVVRFAAAEVFAAPDAFAAEVLVTLASLPPAVRMSA